jgi:putative membrane protein
MINKRIINIAMAVSVALCILVGVSILSAGIASTQTDQNSNSNSNMNSNTGGTGGRSQGNANGALSSADRDFVMKAANAGMVEVQLGQLAAKQGSSDAVRQFGQQMVTDHTATNEKLAQLASTKGVTLPASLDSSAQEKMTKLQALTGPAFDQQYLKDAGVSEHEKTVKLFQKQSTSGKDPDLSAFASATLPTLQTHLSMARTMAGGTSGGSNANMGGAANANMNSNTSGNMNSNTGGNMNSNTGGNMNSNTGGNMNSNTGGNMNSNRSGNGNRNSNSNGNANNGNINR